MEGTGVKNYWTSGRSFWVHLVAGGRWPLPPVSLDPPPPQRVGVRGIVLYLARSLTRGVRRAPSIMGRRRPK
eukprot:scaffold905_cov28-Tisochrysis_lutea.AAC.1